MNEPQLSTITKFAVQLNRANLLKRPVVIHRTFCTNVQNSDGPQNDNEQAMSHRCQSLLQEKNVFGNHQS